MPRFTLPTALLSLTCFCVAVATFRLATTPDGGDLSPVFFVVSCVSAMLGFGVLVNQIGFSILLGFLIVLLIAYARVPSTF